MQLPPAPSTNDFHQSARDDTLLEAASSSQVGPVPKPHAPLKPKMTSRFRRDPAVTSGLPPRPDVVEIVGS